LALTGTPILNRLEELAVILEVIGIIKSAKAFLCHYTSTFVHEFWVNDQLVTKREYYLTPQQEQELRLLLRTKLPYLRRLKSEVGIQLPRKNRTPIPLNINASRASEFLRKAAQEFAEKRRIDIGKYKTDEALVSFIFEHYNHLPISTARRLYAIDKAPLAAEYIKYLTDGLKAPLVVFYHHKEVLDILQERIPGPYIDGSVPQWRRGELVREFQEEKYQVLYLSITAAGLGITLTAADTAVFVEYDWVPANLLQAEDRINRIGQRSEVTYYHYLTTKDPIERLILEKILEKVALAEAVLGGQSGLKETLKNV
jgi:SNF2 family DNA or RNA helicase